MIGDKPLSLFKDIFCLMKLKLCSLQWAYEHYYISGETSNPITTCGHLLLFFCMCPLKAAGLCKFQSIFKILYLIVYLLSIIVISFMN